MEKPQAPARHWKEVHRSGIESNSSLNSSINSNHSSFSAGYNRFQFQRSSVEKDSSKKKNMFQFTARNRDNPHDISVLTKKAQKNPKAPQTRTHVQIRSMESIFRRMQTFGFEKDTKKMVTALLKEVKNIMEMLKSMVDTFKKQYKALRWDWNHQIKVLLAKEVSIDNSKISQLQNQLDQKEKELEKLGKESSFWERNAGAVGSDVRQEYKYASRGHMRTESRGEFKGQTYNSWVDSPLKNLNISKVDGAKNHDNVSKLSRNNTLQSLLGQQLPHQPASIPSSLVPPRHATELQSLRNRVSRMRQLLTS